MKKLRVLIALLTVALAPFALSAQKALTVEQVTSKLDENFKGISTYRAKFEQEVKSEQFAKTLSEGSGELFFPSPARWPGNTAIRKSTCMSRTAKSSGIAPSSQAGHEDEMDAALASGLPKTFLFGIGPAFAGVSSRSPLPATGPRPIRGISPCADPEERRGQDRSLARSSFLLTPKVFSSPRPT